MTLTEEQIAEIRARVEAATQPFAMTNGDYLKALEDRETLLSALEAAEKEVKDARREGLRLATALHHRWYRDISPSWEPFEHAPGLLSQIDNMTAGLGQRLEAANKRADEAEALVRMLEDAETVEIIQTLRAKVAIMQEALEIIAGKRQCLDNLMGNKDVALAALKGASHEQG